jgi:hypothetical protein
MPEDMGGPKGYRTFRPLLEPAKVRYVGDRVAFVVARTPEEARIAAERVEVDYEPLPAAVSVEDAAREGAPQVWDDNAAGNLAFPLMMGNKEATEAAFAKAKHTASVRLYNNRISANAMEPRAAVGDFSNESFTLYTSSQNPHGARSILAGAVFKIPETRLRVISPDVGGGFGMKGDTYPEDGLVLCASRRLGRPVKWVATRTESLLGDNHGRDQLITAEMALDENGRILAVRARRCTRWARTSPTRAWCRSSAPCATSERLCRARHARREQGDLHAHHAARSVPRRRPAGSLLRHGAADGRSRAQARPRSGGAAPAQLHRAERHAVQHHRRLDRRRGGRLDLRLRRFRRLTDRCIEISDWNGYAARKRLSESKGKLRGRALIYYLEDSGVFNERMELRFDPSGMVTIVAGTHSHGQGHATTYAQLGLGLARVPSRAPPGPGRHPMGLVRPRHLRSRSPCSAVGPCGAPPTDHREGKLMAAHLLEARRGHRVPVRQVHGRLAPTAPPRCWMSQRRSSAPALPTTEIRSPGHDCQRLFQRAARPFQRLPCLRKWRSIPRPARSSSSATAVVDDVGRVIKPDDLPRPDRGRARPRASAGADGETSPSTASRASFSRQASWTTPMPRASDLPPHLRARFHRRAGARPTRSA